MRFSLHAVFHKIEELIVQAQWYVGQEDKSHQIKTARIHSREVLQKAWRSDSPRCDRCSGPPWPAWCRKDTLSLFLLHFVGHPPLSPILPRFLQPQTAEVCTDPPQVQERRAEVRHLSGNVLRDLSQERRLGAVRAGLSDWRQDSYLCGDVQLINHWNSVQRLPLDSSVVRLNVSIIPRESPPHTTMGSRKATELITKLFLYLWFSKQGFSCAGQIFFL